MPSALSSTVALCLADARRMSLVFVCARCASAALKGSFLLPDLEDAIVQFDTELAQFGPNLKEVWCVFVCVC